jgi:hypothetical protein
MAFLLDKGAMRQHLINGGSNSHFPFCTPPTRFTLSFDTHFIKVVCRYESLIPTVSISSRGTYSVSEIGDPPPAGSAMRPSATGCDPKLFL